MLLLAVDGNSITASHYSMTEALGFAQIAQGIENRIYTQVERLNANGAVIGFDSPHLFRRDVYSAYKAGRRKDERKYEVYRYTESYLRDRGWCVLSQYGYEADDQVAWAVDHYETQADIVIMSSDKDLYQLLSNTVQFYAIGKKKLYTEGMAELDFGFPVHQMVEAKAIIGDSFDNIPGAAGVGAKGAKQILDTYKTIENAIAQIGAGCEKVKPQVRRRFMTGRDDVKFFLRLVELPYDNNLDEPPPLESTGVPLRPGFCRREKASPEAIKPQTPSKGEEDRAKTEAIQAWLSENYYAVDWGAKKDRASSVKGGASPQIVLMSRRNFSLYHDHPDLVAVVTRPWTEHQVPGFQSLLEHAITNNSLPLLSLCGIAVSGNGSMLEEAKVEQANVYLFWTAIALSLLRAATANEKPKIMLFPVLTFVKAKPILMGLLAQAHKLAVIGRCMDTEPHTRIFRAIPQ